MNRSISHVYKCLMKHEIYPTADIKTNWEKEGGMNITEDDNVVAQIHGELTGRNLVTPVLSSHCGDNTPPCWRKCGHQPANHYHISWECSTIYNNNKL